MSFGYLATWYILVPGLPLGLLLSVSFFIFAMLSDDIFFISNDQLINLDILFMSPNKVKCNFHIFSEIQQLLVF
jgi:hypothetical protein